MLIKLLIGFFIFLIGYQLFFSIFKKSDLIEGLENEEYKPYNKDDPNNALILAQQNAGNIEVLRGRIDKLDGIKEKTDQMQQDMNSMQSQIDALVQQQADYAQQLAGDTPPDVSGTEGQTTADAEQFIAADDEEQ
jgi:Tfp pilus assembly protein PilO